MNFNAGILVAIIFLAGCYNKDFNEPGTIDVTRRSTVRTYAATFDQTWGATQRVFNRFPVEKRNEDVATGRAYLVTGWVQGKSDVLFSGYDRNRIPYTIRYKFTVIVQSEPGGARTTVSIKNLEQYRDDVVTAGVDFRGSVNEWILTDSSTSKERRVLDEIGKLVADRSTGLAK